MINYDILKYLIWFNIIQYNERIRKIVQILHLNTTNFQILLHLARQDIQELVEWIVNWIKKYWWWAICD